jgi:protein-tyrosine phosphatase
MGTIERRGDRYLIKRLLLIGKKFEKGRTMIPFADIHCHLLAGLDDGPRSDEEALAMCRLAYDEGIRLVAATAHQNDRWSEVTPDRIRSATEALNQKLKGASIPLTVFPTAEVMVFPGMELAWQEKKLLSLADRNQYLLVEMPHRLFVDLAAPAREFRRLGVRLIVAHPERSPELLHDPGRIETLIEEGCLVQVSSGSITDFGSAEDRREIKDWFQRGIVHVLGTDGHSPDRRPPKMAEAYRQIVRWTSDAVADRICSTNGLALFHGLPLRISKPEPRSRRWFPWIW